MKQYQKRLAWLMTGVLLGGSLTACGGSSGSYFPQSNVGGSNDDLPYTPSEFYEALVETEDMIFTLCAIDGETVTTTTYHKDGGKVRLLESVDGDADDDYTSAIAYYDFDAELAYESVDGNWRSESITGDWADIIEAIAEELPIFDDDDYTKNSANYSMKENALAKEGMPEGISSVTLGFREDIAYFHLLVEETVLMLQAEFVDVTVTLPDPAGGGQQGSVSPDQAPVLTPPTAAVPDKDDPDKDDPDKDDPDKDDPDKQPSDGAAYMAPSDLCDALYDAEDVTIAVQRKNYYAAYAKDGDKMAVYVGTNANDGKLTYVDFAEGVGYTELNGSWTTTSAGYISWAALLRDLDLTSSLFFFIDPYYNAFTEKDGELTIRSELLDPSSLTSVTMQRDGDTYTVIQKAPDGSDVTFVFSFEATSIDMPV